jgi:hypothetical protein
MRMPSNRHGFVCQRRKLRSKATIAPRQKGIYARAVGLPISRIIEMWTQGAHLLRDREGARQLARDQHQYTDVKPERIERAIADDLAFLTAHPVRRSNSEAMAHRREFKEATRQRIRDIAASRDLSDEEIKPVLKLKHHEIANFSEKHGVNVEWLLEARVASSTKNRSG